MTRLTLNEACLLDLSGELGANARAQLHAHLQANPLAQAEYDRIRANFAILQAEPVPYIPEIEKARLSHSFKNAIRRQSKKRHSQKSIDWRGRLIYAAMASASGIAACLVVTVTVLAAQHDRESQRQQAIARAEESVRDFMNADSENVTDVEIATLDGQIRNADPVQLQQISTVETTGNRARLLEMIDPTPDDEPAKTPGT